MVPEGWREAGLGDVVEVRLGATPARKTEAFWATSDDSGHPWVAIGDLPDAKWITATSEKITSAGVENSSVKLVEPGHTLVSFKLSLGKVARAAMPLYTNEAIAALVPSNAMVEDDFLYYAVPRSIARATSAAQAVKGLTLNKGKLERLRLPLPPLPEQRRIAAILSSVDDAIAATQKVVEQTKRVKKGLLQTLMTRGIGHTRFKKTEIGEIPEGWEVRRLEKVCRHKITYGIVQCGPHVDDGIPYVRVSDMTEPELNVSSMQRTSTAIAAKYERSRLELGDVVYALRGDIGAVRLTHEALEGANLTQGTARLSPARELLSPEFLLWLMRGSAVRREARRRAKGTTFKEITLADLRRLPIPLPPTQEQARIVEVLATTERAIRIRGEAAIALQRLKRGLLQDLLTGRVRVQPD